MAESVTPPASGNLLPGWLIALRRLFHSLGFKLLLSTYVSGPCEKRLRQKTPRIFGGYVYHLLESFDSGIT